MFRRFLEVTPKAGNTITETAAHSSLMPAGLLRNGTSSIMREGLMDLVGQTAHTGINRTRTAAAHIVGDIAHNTKIVKSIMTDYPARDLIENLRKTSAQKFAKLDKQLTADEARIIVASDKDLLKAFKSIEKKAKINKGRIVGVTTTGIVLGVGGLGLWAAVSVYRKQMSWCHRYEILPDGSLKVCKVMQLCCGESADKPDGPVCLETQLTPYQLAGQCPIGSNTGFRCDTNVTDPHDSNYIADRNILPKNVYFRCIEATFADAFADLSTDAVKVIKNAASNTMSMVKYVLYIIAASVIIGGVGTLLLIFKKVKGNTYDKLESEEDEDNNKTTKNNEYSSITQLHTNHKSGHARLRHRHVENHKHME